VPAVAADRLTTSRAGSSSVRNLWPRHGGRYLGQIARAPYTGEGGSMVHHASRPSSRAGAGDRLPGRVQHQLL